MNDPFAKASYRSVIRTARDVVADIGEEAAASSGGLADLARVPESKSERDGMRIVQTKAGLSLPVPLTLLGEADLAFPILRLRDWGQFLADKHCLHMLVGLAKPDFQRETDICQAFWAKYKQLQPDHEIYHRFEAGSLDPKFTFPLVFHGDEGRGRRRLPFLVCNYHSLLGKGTQEQCGQHRAYLKLRINFKDNSLVTRLLYCAVPKKLHQKPQVFDALMESAVAEAEFMVNTGVVQRYTGRKVWFAVIGVTGDWPWLHRCGNLSRSFNNVPKKTGEKMTGICHKCAAGSVGVPWEVVHERNPAWLQTVYSESGFARVPAIARLLSVPGQEEGLLAFDFFHAFHLGIGKNFVGSCLALLSDHFPGSNVDKRFENLELSFFTWCRATKNNPVLTRLTKETIQWGSRQDYPSGSWFKGSVTTVFCRYLEHVLTSQNWPHEPMLQKAGEAAKAINFCVASLYASDVFVYPPLHAVAVAEHGLRFLRRLQWLAKEGIKRNDALWLLKARVSDFAEDSQDAVRSPYPMKFLFF
ncbi:unnamed protein product [Symbiodinium sp. KB8]|nr:unnamed protein product [Symbiodinium sp. KB8]